MSGDEVALHDFHPFIKWQEILFRFREAGNYTGYGVQPSFGVRVCICRHRYITQLELTYP